MQKRKLGKTDMEITQLGYGAMELRGPRIWSGRPLTETEAGRILNAVLDAGINFIDTSYDYGLSEEYIGKYINHRRSEYFLATKCGCTVVNAGDHDDTPHVWTRANLMHNIDESLRRMSTEYVDLMQLHNPTVEQFRSGELLDVLQDMKTSGKVRWIGISSMQPDITTYMESDGFESFQIPYSALEREHENIISRAAQSGAGTIIRGGVGRGEPGEGRRSDINRWEIWEKAKLDDLLDIGESRIAFLLRYTLSHPNLTTAIIGTKNPDHLAENVHIARRGPLPTDVYEEAKQRLDRVGERSEV